MWGAMDHVAMNSFRFGTNYVSETWSFPHETVIPWGQSAIYES